jgi:hypothetical protein
MWRLASSPADASGTVVRGRATPGGAATVSLTRCRDTSGAIAAIVQLNAGADGTLSASEAGDGLCILRIKPSGDS